MKNRMLSVLLVLVMLLGLLPAGTLTASAADSWITGDTIKAIKKGNAAFNIRGVNGEVDYQTTFMDWGYDTVVTVDGGTRQKNPSGVIADGLSLSVDLALEDRNYIRVTYTLQNVGSKSHSVQVGSYADVMIDQNDRAPICAETAGGKVLLMTGNPENNYAFKLVATTCDTLWYGKFSQRTKMVFTDLADRGPNNAYTGDSGAAWSWSVGAIAPGESWQRCVLIGTGDAADMNVTPPSVPAPTPAPIPDPTITLSQRDYYLTEGEALPGDWGQFVASHVGTISVTGQPDSSSTPGDYTVTYTAASGSKRATATLKLHILHKPAALSAATASGSGPFTLSATLTQTGGLTYTETGFVYGALQNPTLTLKDAAAQTASVVQTKGGKLSVTVAKADLADGITYYARPYAKAADGTVIYGAQSSGFGLGVPNYGTVSVSNNGSGTFTFTLTGATGGSQTVYYRTVNGSAVGGTQFFHKSGSVTLTPSAPTQTVTVGERAVTFPYGSNAATSYSNADRVYFIEISRVEGGATIGTARATRTMTKNNNYTVDRAVYNEKERSVSTSDDNNYVSDNSGSGDHKINFQNNRGYNVSHNNLNFNVNRAIDVGTDKQNDYLKATAGGFLYRAYFTFHETENGYQHLWVANHTPSAYGSPTYNGPIDLSDSTFGSAIYTARWETGSGSTRPNGALYLPGGTGTQIYSYSKNVASGKESGNYLVFGVNETAQIWFSSAGADKDIWIMDTYTDYLKIQDAKEPQLLGIAPVTGTYLPGQSITVALVFDEIVDSANSSLTSSSTISVANLGTLSYAGGADTNVLYFTGTVPDGAAAGSSARAVTLNCVGQIKDMCNNAGSTTSTGKNVTIDIGSAALPTVTVETITNTNGTLTATVTATNAGKLEYVWSDSATAPAAGWRMLANSGGTVTTRQTSGTWYLHARATNADGRVVYAKSSPLTIPTSGTGAVSLPSLDVSVDNTSWAKERIITLAYQPAGAEITVKEPDRTQKSVSGESYTATQNGVYTFTLTSGEDTIVKTAVVSKLDGKAPVVSIRHLSNTTHAAPVTLTFSVADGASGADTVTATWNATVATLTKNADGTYSTTSPYTETSATWKLNVTAVDKVGNRTVVNSLTSYTVNNQAPKLTVTPGTVTNTGAPYTYSVNANGNSDVVVTLPDGTSTTSLNGSFTIPQPGTYIITVTDAAGHFVSRELTVTAPSGGTMDGTHPDVRLYVDSKAWTNQSVTVKVDVYEEGSKPTVKEGDSTLTVSAVTSETGSYSGSFTVSENGTYTVTATDGAGNTGTGSLEVGHIDKVPPTVAVSGISSDWGKQSQTVTLTASDALSGVKSVQYAIVGSKTTTPTSLSTLPANKQVSVTGNGTHYIYYKAADNAGNETTGWTDAIRVGPAPHTHAWATAWQKNATHHWHECTAADCPVTENSRKSGYALHAANGEWQKDAANHWKLCVCGQELNKADHTWDSGKQTTAPGCTTQGVTTYTCTTCQATKTEPITASGHSLTKTNAVAASCTAYGVKEYWSCSKCSKHYSDDQGASEIADLDTWKAGDGKVEKAAHTWGTTYEKDANQHWKKCTVCQTEDTKADHTPATDAKVEPTCTTDGKTEGSHCSVCQYVITAQETIPAGHTWGTWTMNAEGTKVTRTCGANCGATEEKSLSITLDKTSYVYGGGENKPAVTVTVDGTALTENTDYTVTYKDNKNVGTATVTIAGSGDYTGSVEKTFAITAKALTATAATATSRVYDGTKTVAVTAVTLDGVVGKDENKVSVNTANLKGTVSAPDVGSYNQVTLQGLTLTGDASGNYTLTQPNVTLPAEVTISQATAPAVTPGSLNITNDLAHEYTFALARLLPQLNAEGITENRKDWGTPSYNIESVTFQDGYYTEGAATIEREDGAAILHLPILSNNVETTGQVGTVTVTVTCANYADFLVTLNINATNKTHVQFEGIQIESRAYNGQPIAYTGMLTAKTTPDGTDVTANIPTANIEITYVGVDGTSYSGDRSKTPPTNAGTFQMVVRVADADENYIGVSRFPFAITKAQGEGSVTMDGFSCGQDATAPVATSTTNGTTAVSYEYKAQGSESWSGTKPTTPGTHTVRATFSATTNYEAVTAEATYTVSHAYAESWSKDDAKHWHECSCGAKDGEADHAGGTASCTAKAVCATCGQSYGDLAAHDYASTWTGDATGHWHKCQKCDATDTKADHTPGDWITDTPATTEAAGSKHKECTTCHYTTETETIPKLDPAHTHAWATVWTTSDTHHWHECTAQGCDVTEDSGKNGYAAHVYDNDQDTTCNTCGYERTVGTVVKPGETTTTQDGTTVEGKEDGSVVVTKPDGEGGGTTTTITPPESGGDVTVDPSTGEVTVPGGSTVDPGNGTKVELPDGGKVDPDGNITLPDGGTVTIPEGEGGSSTTITAPDGGGTIKPTEDGKVEVPTGSTITAGDGTTTTITEGTGAVKPDGTVTLPDGGKATAQTPDGTTSQIVVTSGGVAGEVVIKPNTPEIVADHTALQEVAGEKPTQASTVTVTLTVEKKSDPADKAAIDAVAKAQASGLTYLDMTLTKTVTGGDAPTSVPINDTGDKVLEIVVPYDFTGKKDITAYRKHGDAAEKLTEADTKAEGTFRLEGSGTEGKVYIYASKFSTYAIGYTAETTSPVTPSRPSGSSSTSNKPSVSTSGKGGKVEADSKGNVTITPDKGYQIDKVTVNGKEVTVPQDGKLTGLKRTDKVMVTFKEAPNLTVDQFTDMKPGDWYYDSVKAIVAEGLMNGTGETTFSPNLDTSRAMIATILWRLEGSPEPKAGPTYPDCVADSWYAKAVAWASESGIVKGYDNGNFDPDDPITREQMAVMLWRYAQAKGRDVSVGEDTNILSYVDIGQTGEWAIPALQWATGSGVMQGRGNGALDPAGKATRAEAATMLARYMNNEK